MKTNWKNTWQRLALGAAAAGLVLCVSAVRADEPRPEQLREQMRNLEHKAKELQAAGKEDQANAVRHEMQELREKFAHMAKERHGEQAGGDDRRADLAKKLEHARAELKEAREGGNKERAEDLQRGIRKLEEESARLNQRSGREHGPEQPVSPEQRLQHMREAIGHLHAAGLHEIAENLAREAEHMQQQMHMQAQGGGAEVARLQAEIQELHQAVRKLNARLDEQRRDQR